MSPDMVMKLAKDALTTAMWLSLPALGLGLVVGVVISIFQATTQIQEQTLTFVPKIVAVLLGLLFFGSWMLNLIVTYTQTLYQNLPLMAR